MLCLYQLGLLTRLVPFFCHKTLLNELEMNYEVSFNREERDEPCQNVYVDAEWNGLEAIMGS